MAEKEILELKLQDDEDLPLRELVFRTLRDAILEGRLEPGYRLMEIHLAQQLGVSRTPVREAIRLLEHENLVKISAHRGAVVASFTVSEMRNVLEVREALEDLTAKRAAITMTDADIRNLKEIEARFEETLKAGNDAGKAARIDLEFHEAITRATGNRYLFELLAQLRGHIFRFRLVSLKKRENYQNIIRDHQNLIAGLEKHDPDAASAAIRNHIENQREIILRQLREQEG